MMRRPRLEEHFFLDVAFMGALIDQSAMLWIIWHSLMVLFIVLKQHVYYLLGFWFLGSAVWLSTNPMYQFFFLTAKGRGDLSLLSPFWCSVPGTFYTYSIPAHPRPGLCDPAPTCVTSIHLKRLWLSYRWTTTELPRFHHDNLVSCKPFNFTVTLLTQSLIQ
jgi:hypothetical protein